MSARPAAVATTLAALLVVVGVLAAALAGPVSLEARTSDGPTWTPPAVTQTPVPTAGPTQDPDDTDPALPAVSKAVAQAVLVLVAVAGALLAGVVLWFVARGWRLDGRTDPGDVVPPGDEGADELTDTAVAALREGVALATRALEDDVPPGDAVVGAWVAVETAAARTGVVRDRAQTATEFTVRVLDATRADPAATRELLALYLAARFGAGGVDATAVRRARDLLGVVGQGLVPRDDDAPVHATGRASQANAPTLRDDGPPS